MAGDKPLVTVFGATGSQGKSVVKALVKSGKYRVRGVSRQDPNSEKLKPLRELGAEPFQADQKHKDQVVAACKGAYAVYSVTDFYAIGPHELEYGTTVAEGAKEAGVTHFVWSTLANVEEQSGGKYEVPHFTDKAKVDPVVRKQGFKYHTFVMPAWYYQNWSMFPGLVKRRPDGTVAFTVPLDENTRHTGYDVDDTGPAVLTILENPEEWHDKYVPLAAYHAPIKKWIEDFSKVTGKKAVLERVPDDKAPNEEWAKMFAWFREFSYYGDFDITVGRRAYPGMKDWPEWLRESGWKGETPKSSE